MPMNISSHTHKVIEPTEEYTQTLTVHSSH